MFVQGIKSFIYNSRVDRKLFKKKKENFFFEIRNCTTKLSVGGASVEFTKKNIKML